MRQRRTQIRARLQHIRPQFDHLPVMANRRPIIAALLCRHRIAKKLFSIRRRLLRHKQAGKRQEEEGNAHSFSVMFQAFRRKRCANVRDGMRLLLLLCCLTSLYAQTDPTTFQDLAKQAAANVDTNPALAAGSFQKALALQPQWGEGWLYFGGSLYTLGRYQEALAAFDRGIALTPPLGTSWAFRGLCEFALKHYEKSLEDFQKGETLGLGANHQFESVVRQHAALILIRSSFFDQAMAQLEPLSNYGDNSPDVIAAAGLCALTQTHWPEELSAQKRAVVDLAGKAQWASMSRQPDQAQAAYR